MSEIASWSPRRWFVALGSSMIVAAAIGLPTDVVPNPVFGRPVDVTWWSYPVLVVTALLSGLLVATYVRRDVVDQVVPDELDTPGRAGGVGGLLSFFAIGCPTCNKLAVVALGSTGALDWFAPAQPVLAGLSIAMLVWALRSRLRGETSCPIAA